jgi:ABC-2 type transport system ATP-binding protein
LVIELNSLSKWYGEVIGLNNVTTTIEHGITGLVGPNGAGKSTLMGLAMGQLRPSKGTIRVFGRGVWNNPAVLSNIGYCPEGDPFWSDVTGRQFVTFLAKASGLYGAGLRNALREVIDLIGMTQNADRAIKGYSKGMRQRIKIAQALIHKPKLLILDEPFTGTDPVGRHELGSLLTDLADRGIDILISSHVLHEVESLTKQILMIDHGRIVAEGQIVDVRRTMHNRPFAIRIRVDHPRRLAARLAEMEAVTSLQMMPPDTLMIQTVSPDDIYERLSNLIIERDVAVQEIAATDESLEAIFGYLTGHRDRDGGL